MNEHPQSWWRELFLGPPGPGQGAVRLTLLAVGVYGLFSLNVAVQVRLGLMALQPSLWLCGTSLACIITFYLLVRTGLSQRLAPADPSLTLSQSALGVLITAWGYAIDPPMRGAVIAIMLLNLVWGMFVLNRRQSTALYVLGLAALALAMLWGAATDPQRFPPPLEALHFTFAAILMTAVSVLSANMSSLRHRLGLRTKELREALERIQYLAHHDELTRISNRRHLSERLAVEQRQQRQHGQPMCLALIDIDHFKRVNDLYGHAVGDAVLCHFATTLHGALRASDFAGRWGGEEFLMVAPQASLEDTLAVVERLRAVIQATSFEAMAPGLSVTFSAGITEVAPDEDLQSAIDRADRALYRAKQSGRNRALSDRSLVTA